MEQSLRFFRELNLWSMMLRIVLAMVMGGVVGLERERKGRAAGFRTYMLVALGAAITMILSQYLDLMLNTFMKDAQMIIPVSMVQNTRKVQRIKKIICA